MNFYDILFQQQNAEKVPYSKNYFDTLFAQKFSNIKTMTGTLPLTFTTSETKLRDWTIYGNENGVGERTPNLLYIANDTKVSRGFTFYLTNEGVTATRTGISTDVAAVTVNCTLPAGQYRYTCDSNAQRDVTYDSYIRASGTTLARDNPDDSPGQDFSLTEETTVTAYFRMSANTPYDEHIFKPMICRVGETPTSFIPCGYIVPVQSGGVTTNIFVGSDPLTEGETVSQESTGVEISTASGENTISTSLYNAPKMTITYKGG